MSEHGLNVWMIRLYIVLAATAGAVTGALVDKTLNTNGKMTAFFIGLTSAVFLGPLLLSRFAPGLSVASPEAVGFYYIFASTANAALPRFIRFIAVKAGDPLAFLRSKGESQ